MRHPSSFRVAALTGFVHRVHSLYVVRFLLGPAQAGFAPGMLLYLTYGFRRREVFRANRARRRRERANHLRFDQLLVLSG